MSETLITTKFFVPSPRAQSVSWPCLVGRLNEGRHKKLILLSAPAGYGKTTLLTEWLYGEQSSATLPGVGVAWVSLDGGDNNPSRFWAYAITAVRRVRPDVGDQALAALRSPRRPSLELLLTSFVNEIAATAAPVVLILDDFHVITSPQVHEGLIFLLDHLPAQLRVVIASRSDPPWPLARRRARGEMMELRASDLRFTSEEAAAYLNELMGLGLSAEDISLLEARTEGWIAGLQLAALSMQEREDLTAFVRRFSGSHRLVLDYLVEEVLERQPEVVRAFLLQTSILDRMSASLCDAVWDLSIEAAGARLDETEKDKLASRDFLVRLEKDNLFLVPLDDDRHWYRYHHLFADLLRGCLHQTRPDLVPVLHRRASDWYERHSLVDEAITHALAAEDIDRAATMIEQDGMQMIVRSELSALSRWLEWLPETEIQSRPWLCIYEAWTRYYVGPREGVEPSLQQAEQALHAAADGRAEPLSESVKEHISGHVAALRAYLALQDGDFDEVTELAQRALELLPPEDYARATSAIALAETPRGRGDLVASEQAYARAREIADACGNLPMAVSAVAYMGYQQAKQERLRQAEMTYREALSLAVDADDSQLPAAGLPYVKLGDLMREWNDLERAQEYLARGLTLCLQWGHADSLATGYATLARVLLAQGSPANAEEAFRKAEQVARKTHIDPWALVWMDECRLRIWLAKGELAAADSWAEASGLQSNEPLSFVRDLEHINLARLQVAQGIAQSKGSGLNGALALLERVRETAENAGWAGRRIESLLLQSLAYQAQGKTGRARRLLGQALNSAEPEGYVRVFLDEGPPMRELLASMVKAGQATDYALQLLVSFGEPVEQDKPQLPTQKQLVEPLTVRELEVLSQMALGLTNREIGIALSIAPGTVKKHTDHIYGKLSVDGRMQAVARARELGLL